MRVPLQIETAELQKMLERCDAKGYYHDVDGNCIMNLMDGTRIKLRVLFRQLLKRDDLWMKEAECAAPEWMCLEIGEIRQKISTGERPPEALAQCLSEASRSMSQYGNLCLLHRCLTMGLVPRRFHMKSKNTKTKEKKHRRARLTDEARRAFGSAIDNAYNENIDKHYSDMFEHLSAHANKYFKPFIKVGISTSSAALKKRWYEYQKSQ